MSAVSAILGDSLITGFFVCIKTLKSRELSSKKDKTNVFITAQYSKLSCLPSKNQAFHLYFWRHRQQLTPAINKLSLHHLELWFVFSLLRTTGREYSQGKANCQGYFVFVRLKAYSSWAKWCEQYSTTLRVLFVFQSHYFSLSSLLTCFLLSLRCDKLFQYLINKSDVRSWTCL